MTVSEATKFGVVKLEKEKIPSASLDVEVLLSHIIKKPKEFILTHPEHKLTTLQNIKYKKLINRRSMFEPIAYLTGEKEFYNITLRVNKNVLIPRPETELLIDEVIKLVQNNSLNIIDIGTGSGAIAIALKKNLPRADVTASDISKSALHVAKENARNNKVKIKFINSDLLKKINLKNIDIIVANLPYVPEKEKKTKTVWTKPLRYEPAQALYSGRYGLDDYTKLFNQIKKTDVSPLAMFYEIGDEYIEKTKKLARDSFPDKKITIKKDLCGKNRLLIIK